MRATHDAFARLARRPSRHVPAPDLDDTGMRVRYRVDIRRAELADTIGLAKWSGIAHIMAAIHVAFLWNGQPAALYGLVAIVLLVACGVVATALYRRSDKSDRAVGWTRCAFVGIATGIGTTWGAFCLFSILHADENYRMLGTVIIAGLVSDVFVIGPIGAAALGLILPMVAGAIWVLLNDGHPTSPNLILLLVPYAALALISARIRARHTSQRLMDRLRVAEQKRTIALLLHDFQEGSSDWLWETDADGLLVNVSTSFAQAMGVSAEALTGLHFDRWINRNRTSSPGAASPDDVAAAFSRRVAFHGLLVDVHRDERTRWWTLSGKPKFDASGHFAGLRGVGSDVTQRKAAEDRIAYLADYDPVTGLANRNRFRASLASELTRMAATKEGFALFIIDVDDLKIVNDTFGHAAGDAVLMALAERLTPVAGEGAFVARLDGDEFAVIAPEIGEAEAIGLAQRIVMLSRVPVPYQGAQIEIGLSVGVALAPDHGDDMETLLRRTDLALYNAKVAGKGRIELFAPSIETAISERRSLESDLRHALERQELALVYQPIVDGASLEVICCEALLRWNRPGHGPVSPAVFIPACESTGEILAIGAWVLKTACLQAATWPAGMRVAVNLSIVQARSADLLDIVRAVLAESGLAPDRLELEITESIFLEMTAGTARNFQGLRAMGVRIALDDFGTGFSSLSYLLRLSVDKIKIDRSFIQATAERREGRAVVDSIISLAKTLKMSVTAEGIETREQSDYLSSRGCHEMQGFLFGKPTPAASLATWLAEYEERRSAKSVVSLHGRLQSLSA